MADIVTIAQAATTELVEKKSRFIGSVAPVESEAEAQAFLDRTRSAYRDASHHCYAWVIGSHGEVQRSSDAGEPSGTAGRPILEAIKHAGLTNTAVVVTRYFGGILLGVGGLTRTYAKAAQSALAAAEKIRRVEARRYALLFDYAQLAKVEACLRQAEVCIDNKVFAEKVCLLLRVEARTLASLSRQLADLSNGALSLQDLNEQTYLEIPV